MSLYRKYQHLTRMVEWADNARLAFPVVMIMEMAGIVDIGAGHAGTLVVLVGAAVVTWLGMKWHTRAIGGRPSIMVGELANLPAVLTTIREAVLAGEIDVDIAAVAESRKRGRKVKNGMPTGNGSGRTAKEIFTRAGAK